MIPESTRVVSFVARSLDRLRGLRPIPDRRRRRAPGPARCVDRRGAATRSSAAGWTSRSTTRITRRTCWRSGRRRPRSALVPGRGVAGDGGRGPGRQRLARRAGPAYPVARSLLEAMAAGCVVLASDTEPHRQVITPGRDRPAGRRPATPTPWRGRCWPCWTTRPPTDRSATPRRRWSASDTARTRASLGSPSDSTPWPPPKGGWSMNVLFIHDAFPAQFGRLGLELTRRHGWRCSFLVQSLSSCPTPTPEMLRDPRAAPDAHDGRAQDRRGHPLAADLRAVPRAVPIGPRRDPGQAAAPPRPGRRPRRPGRTDAVPPRRCSTARSSIIANTTSRPAIATSRTGSTCRPPSRPRSSRAASTRRPWRRWSTATPATRRRDGRSRRSRERFHPKIEVHFDGIETELYQPGPAPRRIGDGVDPGGDAGRHVRLARAGVDPRLRPVHEGRRPDRPGPHRRALRRRRRRGDPLRLGQAPHRHAELQAVGAEPGELRPVAVPLPRADPARATGRHPADQRPAHLPDCAVRALVVADERDGQRLRGAGLGHPAGARGDPTRARTAWSSRSSTSSA